MALKRRKPKPPEGWMWMTDVQWCQQVLLADLTVQTDRRREYDGLEWVDAELQAVADSANRWASVHGLEGGYTIERVGEIERSAYGHVDWARKLTLYVAEDLYGVRHAG